MKIGYGYYYNNANYPDDLYTAGTHCDQQLATNPGHC